MGRMDQVSAIFLAVCDLPAAEQDEHLSRLVGTDSTLRAEVERLLLGDLSAKSCVDVPAFEAFAQEIAGANSDHLPERIGHFRIVRKIGEGSAGIVYEAIQDAPQRRVALKLLRSMFGASDLEQRFAYEVAVLGRLSHPGIAQIFEAGSADLGVGRQPYFALELVDGVTLGKYAGGRALGLRTRLELLAQICDAAHHAHQKGVIHRDLKPDNILVTAEGHAKILDFGIARAIRNEGEQNTTRTLDGFVIGTLAYMSPEQVLGQQHELTISSDVYSLGVIGYELFCGCLPHDVRQLSLTEAARIISEQAPIRLGTFDTALKGDIETIIAKALEADKSNRYQSAAELAADLRRHLDDLPVIARPPSLLYGLRKFARRNKAVVASVCAAAVAVVLGIVFVVMFALRAAEQERRATGNAYGLGVRAASNALDRGKHGSARRFLDAAPLDLRGWEWHHVQSQLEMWQRELEAPANLRGPLLYSLDGKQILSALVDGTIACWSLPGGVYSQPYTATNQEARFTVIANNWSATSKRFAAGTDDGCIYLWRAGSVIPTILEEHDRPISSLSWAPDGRLISADDNACRVWSGSGAAMESMVIDGGGTGLRVAPDGSAFLRKHAFTIVVTNLTTHATLRHTNSKAPVCADWSPDSKRIIVGTIYQNLHVLDASDLKRIDSDSGHDRQTASLRVSPDRQLLVSTSDDGTVMLRDATSLTTLGVYPRGRPTAQIAFRSDSLQLAIGDRRAPTLTLWSSPLRAEALRLGLQGSVHYLGWSPDGTLLYAACKAGACVLLDVFKGTVITTIEGIWPEGFSSDSQWIIARSKSSRDAVAVNCFTGEMEELGAWSLHTRKLFRERYRFVAGCRSRQAEFNPELDLMINCITDVSHPGDNRTQVVRLVDRPNGDHETLFSHRNPGVLNSGAAFSSDGQRLAVSIEATQVAILDRKTLTEIGRLPDVHTKAVMSIDFSPDGTRIVTGSHDNMIRVFDGATYDLRLEIEGHRSHVAAVRFSPDGSRIATGSGDGTLRIWDSIPRSVRAKQARLASELHERMQVLVDELIAQHVDRASVARALRARTLDTRALDTRTAYKGASLTADETRAALHVLAMRSDQEERR